MLIAFSFNVFMVFPSDLFFVISLSLIILYYDLNRMSITFSNFFVIFSNFLFTKSKINGIMYYIVKKIGGKNMARGRGKLTPQDKEDMKVFSANLNSILSDRNCKQAELSRATGIPPSTLTGYVKGTSLPIPGNVQKIADFFGVPKSVLDPRFVTNNSMVDDSSSNTSSIQTIYDQLEPPRQGKVLTFAERQLKEQNKEETKINEVSENIIRLDDYRQTTYRRVTGVVSAGSGSIQDDDLDMEVSFYEDEIPDDYDAIAYVVGNSMEPKIKNGDYLFIKNTQQVDYNTIGIFQVDGANYVKKLRQGYLESLNPDYEDIHLDESNDIRTIGEVVSVYREK
ncbi:phage DNA binding protein [Streptococcus phage K13]|uniref:Phage DNA binding protein n=17 Tax=root TaxID=1 RepID=A0A060QNS7_9CAUD|nr:transcriptional regulator [Streptococcus phage K13]CDL74014.1 phage DNA binding protein [Streptococcus phage K13]